MQTWGQTVWGFGQAYLGFAFGFALGMSHKRIAYDGMGLHMFVYFDSAHITCIQKQHKTYWNRKGH